MEKEKAIRKKSTEKKEPSNYNLLALPTPPPDPKFFHSTTHDTHLNLNNVGVRDSDTLPDCLRRILGYKDREDAFIRSFPDSIASTSSIDQASPSPGDSGGASSDYSKGASASTKNFQKKNDETHLNKKTDSSDSDHMECEEYIITLLSRSGPSIAAALVSYGAFGQLDKLHSLLEQLMTIQDENYRMNRKIRDLQTIDGLFKFQKQQMANEREMNKTIHEDPNSDFETVDGELEFNVALLDTILAAGRSASNKRINAKRERSKSVIAEEISIPLDKENKPYPLRRQSAITDIKAKVSKWTKVKAAFKWERANVPSLNEGKSTDSGIGLTPVNHEVARYLRVPSIPCAGSSADSILSSSSGHMLSGGSIPASPGTISSASSVEDIGPLSEENRTRDSYHNDDDEARRSRSLDGDTISGPNLLHHNDKNKNKTPWRKVKDIIQTHRGSVKTKQRSRSIKSISGSVGCSRDVSPCDSVDAFSNSEAIGDRSIESCSSNQASPVRKTPNPALMLTAPTMDISVSSSSGPTSPVGANSISTFTADESDYKSDGKSSKSFSTGRGSRKNKLIAEIGCLPEGIEVDAASTSPVSLNSKGKPPPSPLNIRQDSSDAEIFENSASSPVLHRKGSKWSKVKKAFLTGTSSVPSSPSRQSEFFGEFESEDLSSGDFSEPTTPQRKLSGKAHNVDVQKEEIQRRYLELQQKINHEFEVKQLQWGKIRAAAASSNTGHIMSCKEDSNSIQKVGITAQPVGEDNLPPEFKKKLIEWRLKKQQSTSSHRDPPPSPASTSKDIPEHKKIDWQRWKTGQFKFEGQGLKPLPDEKDLPEEFQKKLDEWKRIKSKNNVPSFNDSSLKRQSTKFQPNANKDSPTYNSKKAKNSEDFEKEILKVEREKQRLERERHKCLEREKAERLSKLKAIVADPPVKEVVVQTSLGVLKFEGISRKFTRKLYEWEKSRGIGPEASTFALLHPGYRPLVVGNGEEDRDNKHERSPCMMRSMSMDSVSPNPSVPSISHQPSSLSLNDVDDLKETANSINNDRKICSNPDLPNEESDGIADEPEAVIVEVEDDIVETAAPLIAATPIVEQQTPVYRYEKARNDMCTGQGETVLLRHSSSAGVEVLLLESLRNIGDFSMLLKRRDSKRVKAVLRRLGECLPQLGYNIKRNFPDDSHIVDVVYHSSDEIHALLKDLNMNRNLENTSVGNSEHLVKLQENFYQLEGILNVFQKQIDGTHISSAVEVPEINITPVQHEMEGRSLDTVSITPSLVQKEVVVVNQVQVIDNRHVIESGNPFCKEHIRNAILKQPSFEIVEKDCQIDDIGPSFRDRVSEQDARKIAKNLNNGTKRKNKTRRLGSRQNSKTESDSDEETQNFIIEAPRKVKRKTSRAKKLSDMETKIEQDERNPAEDIVYVLKIRPGQKIEQTEVSYDFKPKIEDSVLISPAETPIELLDESAESIPNTSTTMPIAHDSSVFVKTKRKIFSPVNNNECGEPRAVIGCDIESSGSSDKNEIDESIGEKVNKSPSATSVDAKNERKIISNLPPLPQSPSTIRRQEQQKLTQHKEPSPSIRLMIAKYNQRLNAATSEHKNSSPLSSGSCSPTIWRSPILERRVRTQTEKYEEKVFKLEKSSSAGNVRRQNSYKNVNIGFEQNLTKNQKSKMGVVKSSSTGILKSDWQSITNDEQTTPRDEFQSIINNLAYDSIRLKEKKMHGSDSKLLNSDDQSTVEGKKERLYRKRTNSPVSKGAISKQGAIRKISAQNSFKSNSSMRRYLSQDSPHPIDELYTVTCPDKSDNTGPRISRKYEGKTSSSRVLIQDNDIPLVDASDGPTSAPTTPLEDGTQPKTPLSERALKLQRAKEEFLNNSNILATHQAHELWNNRLSQISGGSGSESSAESCQLTKSASVGMIGRTPADNHHPDGYVSLPRNAKSSGKSRFGLSNLASKLRKVKLRKSSKDLTKMNTVSLLCRQSLIVDITGTTETLTEDNRRSLDERRTTRAEDHSALKHFCSSGTLGPSTSPLCEQLSYTKDDNIRKSKSTTVVLDSESQSSGSQCGSYKPNTKK